MTAVDNPRAREAIERSADPVVARAAVARIVDAHPWVEAELDSDEHLLDAIVAVAVASHSLFAALERDPVAVTMLRGAALAPSLQADDFAAEANQLIASDDPPRSLRRWKREHLVRIAGRDLLELAGLREVGRELAALAEAALDLAVDLAAPGAPLAVVGMGKLGGEELNYSSDVDVLFVHDGDTADAERAARDVLRIMSAPGVDGLVFRTDAALRPEGRSGALSRTLDSYAAYWEQWAQTWELQALIKARPVAGDRALGAEFITRATPFVWPDVLDPNAVREVRAMKARTETMLQRQGLADREVKRGYGGIRDIEFAVQLLQLVHGRHDESIRSRTTLDALERLARGGYVSPDDAGRLDAAYVWLRTVEHRLQLVDEHQTHTIPDDGAARTHLARVLGFRDRGDVSAVEAFDGMHQHHQSVVRRIHEEVFFAPVLETLAGVGPLLAGALETRLAAFGFADLDRT